MDRDVNIIVGSNFHPIDLKSGMLPLSLPLRREGLYSLKAFAPMQYRHEIGHPLANFAFAADTKRKTSVPLFFASTGGLRLPLFHAYTASVASIHWLLQSSTPQIFSKYRAQIVLFHAYRVKITLLFVYTGIYPHCRKLPPFACLACFFLVYPYQRILKRRIFGVLRTRPPVGGVPFVFPPPRKIGREFSLLFGCCFPKLLRCRGVGWTGGGDWRRLSRLPPP